MRASDRRARGPSASGVTGCRGRPPCGWPRRGSDRMDDARQREVNAPANEDRYFANQVTRIAADDGAAHNAAASCVDTNSANPLVVGSRPIDVSPRDMKGVQTFPAPFAHVRDLGIGVRAARNVGRHALAAEEQRVLDDGPRARVSRVGEPLWQADVAGREHGAVGRTQVGVDCDAYAVQATPASRAPYLPRGHPSRCNEDAIDLDGSTGPHRRRCESTRCSQRLETGLHPTTLAACARRRRRPRAPRTIAASSGVSRPSSWPGVDERHLGAQPLERLREFAADGAAAEHEQSLRLLVSLEDRLVRQRIGRRSGRGCPASPAARRSQSPRVRSEARIADRDRSRPRTARRRGTRRRRETRTAPRNRAG